MSSVESQSSSDSDVSSQRDLKAKIMRFEAYEQSFKHYSKQLNHALTYPNEYEKEVFQALLDHEDIELNKLFNVYNSLSAPNRRPYDKLIKIYQQSVAEHKQLVQLLDDEEKYLERIQHSRQINFDLLSEYKETLTAQYLLRGVMGLLGAFIVHLIIGASSRWNMLNAYATSYYKILKQPYLIVNEDSYASPLSLFCMGLGMRAGIRLDKAAGTLLTCGIALLSAVITVMLSSLMPQFERTNVPDLVFVIFAFALYPFLTSLAFHAVINQCYKYYPKLKLLINGVIIVGTGFGHIFFGMLNDQCINPEDRGAINGFFGGELDDISRQVPTCMRQMGVVVLVLGTVAVTLLYPLIKYNVNKGIVKRHERTKLDFEHSCASEREALGSRIFWVLLVVIVLTTSGLYFLNSNFKNLRIHYETNTLKQASVLFAFNLSNSLSRPFWAFAFSKIGFKFAMLAITCTNIVVLATLELILASERIYMIYFVLAGVCLGGCMVAFFNLTILVFGEYVGEQLPGYVWTCYSIANLLQYILVNTYNVSEMGYLPVLLALAAFNVLSLVIVLRTRLQGEWENNLNLLQFKCYF